MLRIFKILELFCCVSLLTALNGQPKLRRQSLTMTTTTFLFNFKMKENFVQYIVREID